MKRKDIQALKQSTAPELEKKVAEARKKLSDLAFGMRIGKVKNVREARSLRKDVARMLTELNAKH